MAPYHACMQLEIIGCEWPPTLFMSQTEAGRAKKETEPASLSGWEDPPLIINN